MTGKSCFWLYFWPMSAHVILPFYGKQNNFQQITRRTASVNVRKNIFKNKPTDFDEVKRWGPNDRIVHFGLSVPLRDRLQNWTLARLSVESRTGFGEECGNVEFQYAFSSVRVFFFFVSQVPVGTSRTSRFAEQSWGSSKANPRKKHPRTRRSVSRPCKKPDSRWPP